MKFISRAAGLAAATLVAGTLAAVAPANAASGSIKYDCTDPLGGKHVFDVVAETDAPATIEAGKPFTPKMTATVSVPDALRDLLYNVGARTIESTTNAVGQSTSINYSVNGVAASLAGTVPVTTVTNTEALQVVTTGTGSAITPTAAGQVKITAGDFTAVLAGKDDAQNPSFASPYTIPCTVKTVDDSGAPLVQDLTIDTVTVTAPPAPPAPPADPEPAPVVKADTKTKVNGKYIKKKKMIKAVVKVKGGDTKATGKAKVVVKLGKKTVKKLNVKVKNGKAVAKIKKITRKGKYKVVVTYKGDKTHKRSKGKAVVKVK